MSLIYLHETAPVWLDGKLTHEYEEWPDDYIGLYPVFDVTYRCTEVREPKWPNCDFTSPVVAFALTRCGQLYPFLRVMGDEDHVVPGESLRVHHDYELDMGNFLNVASPELEDLQWGIKQWRNEVMFDMSEVHDVPIGEEPFGPKTLQHLYALSGMEYIPTPEERGELRMSGFGD